MRLISALLIFFCNTLLTFSQPFDVVNIKDSGSDDKRINLVILSDGYQTSELDQFITDATSFTNAMFSQSPFSEYINYFNVYAIKVPSAESGADHPATATDTNETGVNPEFYDTYFNATFDSYGYHRFLYYEIDGNNANNTYTKIINLLASHFPLYDQALILVNTPTYGGTGGQFPLASAGADGNETAIHELGHSLFDLKDEYYQADVYAGEAINMTQETDLSLVRWKNWGNDNGVGLYQHTDFSGNTKPWYRPHENCKMRALYKPFCSVCKEGMVEKIHNLVSPIDTYTPDNPTLDNPTFPLNFQLALIKPIPNTLKSEWTLNASNFDNDVDDITLLETDLVNGANILTAVIHDNSAFLRIDNHDSFHVDTVTWTINYSTLGIESIENKTDTYSISLFPNPSNTVINLTFESNHTQTIKVNILSMDGKLIKTTSISNYATNQMDISDLSTGIYLTNFYSGNALIASKKLVKN